MGVVTGGAALGGGAAGSAGALVAAGALVGAGAVVAASADTGDGDEALGEATAPIVLALAVGTACAARGFA